MGKPHLMPLQGGGWEALVLGSGACQALRWEPSGRATALPALPAPSPGAPEGIDLSSSLFGLLINCNCTRLEAEEIYGHHPASPVSLAACQGAGLLALPRLPQTLGSLQPVVPLEQLSRAVPFCSKLPKRSLQILIPS